jgi:uncharacterized surface protein with fasciclin (FAS1) repeats
MKEIMPEKQNQHYVPQYYFRFFSEDKKSICMLLKSNGKIIKSTPIDTQSSKNNFYGDVSVESRITEFDTKYSANHSIILKQKDLNKTSEEQIEYLMENIQFQRLRTLSARDANLPVLDFYRDFFKPQIENLDNYDSGHSEEATKAVNAAMKMFFDSFSDPKLTQIINLENIKENKEKILDLKLVFLINNTNKSFIFSDSPAAFSNYALRKYKCSKLGDTNVGLQIFFPLSPKLLIFLYDPDAYSFEGLMSNIFEIDNEEDILSINRLQFHEAFNAIYFSDITLKHYVEKIWKEESRKFKKKKNSVVKAKEITLDGYVTGKETYSINEEEPAYFPKLSFLKVKKISDSANFLYRKRFMKHIPIISLPQDTKRIKMSIDQYDYSNE